jgi:hypothetical protein
VNSVGLWDGSSVLVQGGSNMTGTNCDLFTHNQSRSYLNHPYKVRSSDAVLAQTDT